MKKKADKTKSERTRQAILDAARELFAKRGFNQATVRQIAGKARVDPALVIRYFGNKDTLFTEAVEINLHLPDFQSVPRGDIGAVMAGHFLDIWEDPNIGPALVTLLKTAVSNKQIADQIGQIFRAQVMPALEGVVDADELPLRASMISSQLLGIALTRYVLEQPPITDLARDSIRSALAPTLQRYIDDGID